MEDPEKCSTTAMYESKLDAFIKGSDSSNVTDEVKSDFERLKLDHLKREINRNKEIDTGRFKEYKDFSSLNQAVPSNDEIVAALRTLQNAGFGEYTNNYNNMSMLMGNNDINNNSVWNMMGHSSINPMLIQSLIKNNMSLGF